MAWEAVLQTWAPLAVVGKTGPVDSDLGMEEEPPAQGHMHPSKEEIPLDIELTMQLGSVIEVKYKEKLFFT